jgi:hypothetical protein
MTMRLPGTVSTPISAMMSPVQSNLRARSNERCFGDVACAGRPHTASGTSTSLGPQDHERRNRRRIRASGCVPARMVRFDSSRCRPRWGRSLVRSRLAPMDQGTNRRRTADALLDQSENRGNPQMHLPKLTNRLRFPGAALSGGAHAHQDLERGRCRIYGIGWV